ncbi:hypothetical protein STENM223S_07396 [Streptomyces tendae]
MLRYQPPLPPACTQWPAVHTMLDLPGWFTSLITVPEQTIEPSGESKKTLPTGAAFSWYGFFSATASTGAGSGSVAPWSAAASLVTVLSASLADFIRSGFHRPSITGLTKSLASLSQVSLSQFFQPPSFHWSTSMPCSLSRSARLVGRPPFPLPASPVPAAWEVPPPGLASASSSSGPPQAVAVSASAATRPAAVSAVRRPRRGAADTDVERMVRRPPLKSVNVDERMT